MSSSSGKNKWYLTLESEPDFPNKDVGIVALRMTVPNHPKVKLVHRTEDIEYGVVDGEIKQVVGTGPYWDRMERPGEKEILELFLEEDRWERLRHILDRQPTQHEMDVATDVIQWLGTACGHGFIRKALQRFQDRETTKDIPAKSVKAKHTRAP